MKGYEVCLFVFKIQSPIKHLTNALPSWCVLWIWGLENRIGLREEVPP